jgi:hypothetical protein
VSARDACCSRRGGPLTSEPCLSTTVAIWASRRTQLRALCRHRCWRSAPRLRSFSAWRCCCRAASGPVRTMTARSTLPSSSSSPCCALYDPFTPLRSAHAAASLQMLDVPNDGGGTAAAAAFLGKHCMLWSSDAAKRTGECVILMRVRRVMGFVRVSVWAKSREGMSARAMGWRCWRSDGKRERKQRMDGMSGNEDVQE